MTRTLSFVGLCVILLGKQVLTAQPALDSLKLVLDKEQNDSTRFQLLLRMSKESEFYDFVETRRYAEEAKVVAEKLNADWAKGRMLLWLGILEKAEGDYAEALKYNLECMEISRNTGDSIQLARALNNVGTGYRDVGEYQESYFYLTRSYRIARNRAKVPNHADSLMMTIALHNIGTVFAALGQYEIALGHLQASQKMSANIKDDEGPAYSLETIGELYRKKGDFELSEKSLFEALAEARKLKIRVLVPRIQFHLANLYLDKEEFDKSLLYFDSVKALQVAINNQFGQAECDLGKGMVMSSSGKFDEALKLYSRSLRTAYDLNARNMTLACYKELATLYEVRHDFEKSLAYQKRHELLKDSLFSESTMEKLSQNQVRFETESKDTEIAALSQLRLKQTSEIKRQELVRNILVVVAALSTFLLFSVYRNGQRRKRINRLLLDHQEEIKRRSIELEQLNEVKDKFFSVISHDLRSPMNALAGTLNLLEEKKVSQEEFSDLSRSLRLQFNHTRTLINNLLDWTLLQMDKLNIQPENVLLKPIVEESFNSLRSLYPKNIILENKIANGIAGRADRNVLSLVLRNLILNAIKFTESGGHIWVNADEMGSAIRISVSDNGIGIDPVVKSILFEKTSGYSTRGTANEKGTGLGLILCKEFVEKNGGRIWLESEVGKGTTFFFTLPKAA